MPFDPNGPSRALRAHGGLLEQELAALGLDLAGIVDFSVNVNPYGPSAAVVEAARGAALERYPDPTGWSLRQALARQLDVAAGGIVVGSGAADLFWTFARVLVRPGDCVLVIGPTFAEFPAAVRAVGGEVHEWRARETTGFAVDLAAIRETARRRHARVVYLCAPNNPTGVHVPLEQVRELALALPDVTILLDQAFLSLSIHHAELAVALPPSVVCVRSMTKDHAIPGLRLGYLLTTSDTATQLEAGRPPWVVSAPALAAGLAALDEDAFVVASRARLMADRDALTAALRGLGLSPLPSATIFFLLPVADASGLRSRLLARNVLVRDGSSFGLPSYLRLAARPAGDRARLLDALRMELLL